MATKKILTDLEIDGNVGIGTTSPNVLGFLETGLNIAAGSSSSTTLQQAGLVISGSSDADDADDFGYLSFTNYQSTLSSDRIAEIRVLKNGTDVDTGEFAFYTANGTNLNEAMRINASGNVGIGTASPTEKLDIDGNVQATGDIKMYEGKKLLLDSDGDGFCSLRFDNTSGDVIYQSSGEHHFLNGEDLSYETVEAGAFKKNGGTSSQFLKADGSVDTNSYLPLTGGSLSGSLAIIKSQPAFSLVDSSGGFSVAYIQHIAGDIHVVANSDTIFKNDGTQTMVLQENGNVGIGNFSPSEKLEVDGNAKADSFIKDGGTSSQFLKADGSVDSNSYLTASSLSGYVDTTTTQTIGGTKTFSGNLGIGLTPTEKLHISGEVHPSIKVQSSSDANYNFEQKVTFGDEAYSLIVGGYKVMTTEGFNTPEETYIYANNAKALSFLSTGAATFSNTVTGTNFILSSDSRLKENVEEVDNKSINVDWKTFEMKSNKGQKRYGVIAQELEEVHPEFVRTDDEGMKSVAYVDLLIAKIAELEARLEKLEK